MSANFLHGVETIELTKGPVPVTVVKSSVIGLVGIAPKGDVNTLTLVQNANDDAQFGEKLTGFSIPQALDAIRKQGGGAVLVVNVFDEATHTSTVTNETQVVANRKVKTSYAPVSSTAPVVKNNAGNTTYVEGTDYTIDDFGTVTILSNSIAEGDTLKITYKKLNAAAVVASHIIGTVNGTTGAKTGFKCFKNAFDMFGMKPKILIAPGYSSLDTVATEMISVADEHRAISLIDAPVGTTVANAITGRGPAGDINFYTSSKRAYLLFPMLKAYDAVTDSNLDVPYSQFMAGVMAATDVNEGYWVSPSNKEIKGIVGIERNISWAINDANTDANLLNEKGITTVASGYGTGFRTWGNRSAAFPTSTHPSNFVSVQRTADILHESLELAMLQFIDKPINNAVIDSIKETVNAFIRTLIGRGALVDGQCTYDKAKNPPVEVAAGHLTFDITFMPPTPAERITFDSFIDINLLKTLG